VEVGKAYKCPHMNTINVLVHKSLEFSGLFRWPWLAVWHDIVGWLGGEFCEKMTFVIFLMLRFEWPPKAPK